MKVCIVTVYNSINSGSYWQAKALGMTLEKMGIEVVYLKRNNGNGSSSSIISKFKEIIKKCIKYGFKEAKRQIKMFKEFDESHKGFKVIPNQKKSFDDIDYFILGSDTIWNLDSNYFLKNYKIYFGGVFEDKKVISYAASVGNTSLETIKKFDDIPTMLNKMQKVAVRDIETFNIVKEVSNNSVEMVCDPTLLISKDDYSNIELNPKDEKYIFLYLFSPLSEIHVNQLKEFAKKNNLKIISGVTYFSYADKCIVNAPNSFLNYMLYADYIITDTFHGTIFSINLEKNFVAIDRDKKKVTDDMKRFELDDRLIKENIKLEEMFNQSINYENTRKILYKVREDSIKFLKESLK